MSNAILTCDQAKQARATLELSQGVVASALDVNRSYLSQFENGRLLLSDATLKVLRRFYEVQGFEFDSAHAAVVAKGRDSGVSQKPVESSVSHIPKIMDGFVIPPQMSEQAARETLAEYMENQQGLQSLLGQELESSFFFGVDEEDRDRKGNEALRLMARNYVLIEQLRNNTALPSHEDSSPVTVGQHVSHLIRATI